MTFPARHLLDAYDARNPYAGRCSDFGDDDGNLCGEPDPSLGGVVRDPDDPKRFWPRASCCTNDAAAKEAAVAEWNREYTRAPGEREWRAGSPEL